MVLATPVSAQINTKPALDNWRPKDGLYAIIGKDFDDACGEYGDFIIEFAEQSVRGHEWDCKVIKRTETAPDAMKLNMTCSDYNLAAVVFPRNHPGNEETRFKEVLELKKINTESMLVRKTMNGKFSEAGLQVNFCPENWQRSYIESKEKTKKEVEQKAHKAR